MNKQNSKKSTKKQDYNKKYYKQHKKQRKIYLMKNKKRIRLYHKKYKIKNKEKYLKYQRFYRDNHKKCQKIYHKKYYIKNKDKYIERTKNRRIEKSEEVIIYNRKYYLKNKDKIKLRNSKYRLLHKAQTRAYRKNYRMKNKQKIKKYEVLYLSNPINKIRSYLRSRIYNALKGKTKSESTIQLLGCSIDQLKQYLEKQFKEGMNWSNYGTGWNGKGMQEWHIDHIVPCASFDLSKPSEQARCFHYTNLQPLWAEENWSKNKY
jgi:hypothetical protein